ncbi:MAG: FAD:protein FMN transferase [Bacteroidales bacterium]
MANRMQVILPALLILIATWGCQRREALNPVRIQGETQGTYYAITYFDSLSRNFSPQIDSILHAIDWSVSVYNKESLISRLNNNKTDSVDLIFTENLRIAAEVSEASGGAFDCTIGRLIEAWGWGFSKRNEITPALIDSLRGIAGYNRVAIENGRLVKEDTGIIVNFNAIAQGYTSDLIARFLHAQGVHHFLVDVGGELVASGTKPGEVLWTIGIELPTEDNTVPEDLNDRPTRAVLSITDKGVATSGNYRKFYVENGVKYSHTIDPSTGYPVKHSLLSATVVACDATTADAWATAFMVMGLEKAIVMLEKHPELQAYFIYSDEAGNDRTWMSDGLKASITE